MATASTFSVRLPDEESLEMMKVILSYESVVRGRRLGQTLAEIVMESVDIDKYPEEVREHLREIGLRESQKTIDKLINADREVADEA